MIEKGCITLSKRAVHGCRPPQDNPKTLNTQLYIQLYQKKLARFRQFADLYPECYWVFVGDNGQVRSPLCTCPSRFAMRCVKTSQDFLLRPALGLRSALG